MFSRKTWLGCGLLLAIALVACAGANGDPAPIAPEAGASSGFDPSCIDAGAQP